MVQLTKEYFDKKLKTLVTKKDLDKTLDKRLGEQTQGFKIYTDEQTETLAQIVNKAFQGQKDHFDKRFDTLETGHEEIKLRLDNVAYRFELVELQKRVETLEEKVGIKLEKK